MDPARLLVVDDDENNRDMLSRRLIRRGFVVECAASGADALAMIDAGGFDLVLLDVMMPGISGLEVLKTLRTQYPPTTLPIIMATARGEREDIAEAFSMGANDYVTKPIDFVVAMARVETQLAAKRAVDKIIALERDLQKQNAELAAANLRMRRELAMAAKLQQSLLPSHAPDVPGLRAAWAYEPCEELGGDILNIFQISPDEVGMYVLDVSGHGVPAALLSTTLSRVLQPASNLLSRRTAGGQHAREPAEVLTELNRRFPMDAHNGQYFTILYGILDTRTFELRYASAGHPPALLVPCAGTPEFLESAGFAVGWVEEAEYNEHRLNLNAGDRLYLYSDGIAEAMNGDGAAFGSQRLTDAVASPPPRALDLTLGTITTAVSGFRNTAPRTDDISILAIERTG